MAAAKSMSPCAAVNPASGRITSLGRGGNRFSSAIASPAPGAPSLSIRSVAQPATPPAISPAETAYVISIMPATLGTAPPPSPWRTPPTRPAAHHTPAMRENTPARRGRLWETPAAQGFSGLRLEARFPSRALCRGTRLEGACPVGDDLTEKAPPGIDTTTPTFARVYDYFLGGKDNFAADRAGRRHGDAACAGAAVVARGNRAAFMQRAVRYLAAEQGIDQFIDIGSRAAHRGERAPVRADANPGGAGRLRRQRPDRPRARAGAAHRERRRAFIQGDLYEPEKIFTDPALTGMIDLSRPVGVILAAIIHHVPDDRDPAESSPRCSPIPGARQPRDADPPARLGDDPRVGRGRRVLQSGLGGSYFRTPRARAFHGGADHSGAGRRARDRLAARRPAGPLEHPLHSQMAAVLGRKD